MMFSTFVFVLATFFVQGLPAFGDRILLPVKSSKALRLAQIGLLTLDEEQSKELVQVVEATTQVESDESSISNVVFRIKHGLAYELCEVDVLERPSSNKTEVIHSGCTEEEDESDERRMFDEFIEKYNKVYVGKSEYLKRFQIFKNTLKKIESLRTNSRGTAEYGITFLADFSSEDLENYSGFGKPDDEVEYPQAEIPDIEIPDELDWRKYNIVSPVKTQGRCFSSWAFCAVGNIEGLWALKHKQLYNLSVQQVLDCDKISPGCEGGLPVLAFVSICRTPGIETEEDYPYIAENGRCRFDKNKIAAKISSYIVLAKNETEMAKWLAKYGPIAVSLNLKDMMHYKKGVSHPSREDCKPDELNHGALIVGYGVEKSANGGESIPYWIIKNSWGKDWGEEGYYRLYRGDGSCGIDRYPITAYVK